MTKEEPAQLHNRAYRVLKWWVRHEGECLADHPDIAAETRAIVAGIEAAARIKAEASTPAPWRDLEAEVASKELDEFLKRHE